MAKEEGGEGAREKERVVLMGEGATLGVMVGSGRGKGGRMNGER